MMRWAALLGLGGLMLAGTAGAEDAPVLPAGDAAQGKKIARMCQTCHGRDGYAKIPIAPHIGGEPVGYLAAQLAAFRSGAREHEMMTVVAKGLSDQQIADVSAWYAGHFAKATLPAGVDPAAAPEACVACHGADGISLFPDAPNLAAESVLYIDTQLKAFKRGKRTHEIMSAIAAELSDDDIRAISEWYAAVELEISKPE